MVLGIIGGTSLFGTKLLEGAEEKEIETKYGRAYLLFTDEVVFIPRHGKAANIPPHRINYKANLAAFEVLNVEKIIGATSVGSLKRAITPRSLVVPHDYISLCSIPSIYDGEIVHVTPGLDEGLRSTIIEVAKELGLNLIEQGVYFHTAGPRLETKAEISFMKNYADVVGMNMASEATLATELGLRYANISTVENYAHGIIEEEVLDYKKIIEDASKSRADLEKVLIKLIEVMAGT
ncbi:MAG TPA: 6-oxopurine nucleoside phosphorylase [Methanophagales archaeon]|nr:6-oxopurine nucleoside phosphorylase [Methanophagales archaeon]